MIAGWLPRTIILAQLHLILVCKCLDCRFERLVLQVATITYHPQPRQALAVIASFDFIELPPKNNS
jgi:hypothetical protein